MSFYATVNKTLNNFYPTLEEQVCTEYIPSSLHNNPGQCLSEGIYSSGEYPQGPGLVSSIPINIHAPPNNNAAASYNAYPFDMAIGPSPLSPNNSSVYTPTTDFSSDLLSVSPMSFGSFMSDSSFSPESSLPSEPLFPSELSYPSCSPLSDSGILQDDFCLEDLLEAPAPCTGYFPEDLSMLGYPNHHLSPSIHLPLTQENPLDDFLTLSLDIPAEAPMQTPSSPTTTHTKKTVGRRRGPRFHQCPFCPHTSNRANNMKEHIRTHDPHRPKNYVCSTCDKRFARKHDMKRHEKSHNTATKHNDN